MHRLDVDHGSGCIGVGRDVGAVHMECGFPLYAQLSHRDGSVEREHIYAGYAIENICHIERY